MSKRLTENTDSDVCKLDSIDNEKDSTTKPEHKYKRWTKEEDALVLSEKTNEEIAELLERTLSSVKSRKYYLCKRNPDIVTKNLRWTKDEDVLIHSGLKPKEIAEKTGRTVAAVYSRKQYLSESKRTKKWTSVEDALIQKNLPIKDIAIITGRTTASVSCRRRVLRKEHKAILTQQFIQRNCYRLLICMSF